MNVAPKASMGSKFSLKKNRKPAGKAVTFSSPTFIEYDVFESDDESVLSDTEGAQPAGHTEQVSSSEPQIRTEEIHDLNDSALHDPGSKSPAQAPDQARRTTKTLGDSAISRQISSESTETRGRPNETRVHGHKNSQGSFQSETGSSVTTVDDADAKDAKKKKGVFSGLFKRRSKREKVAEHSSGASTGDTAQVAQTANAGKDRISEEMVQPSSKSPQTLYSDTSRGLELPAAVKEMRSSVLMETDPLSVDMIEEPHHRGPVDEVEMLHTQRARTPLVHAETPDPAAALPVQTFVWTDLAIDSYLASDKNMHKNLIVMVRQQAKTERNRSPLRFVDGFSPYDEFSPRLDQMSRVRQKTFLLLTISKHAKRD